MRNIFIQLSIFQTQIRPNKSGLIQPEIIIKPKNLKIESGYMTADELGLITNIILDAAEQANINNNGKEIDIKLEEILQKYIIKYAQHQIYIIKTIFSFELYI